MLSISFEPLEVDTNVFNKLPLLSIAILTATELFVGISVVSSIFFLKFRC